MLEFLREFRVYLTDNSKTVFPDRCVVCGESCDCEEHYFTGRYEYEFWFFNRWKAYLSQKPKIFVPIHLACKNILATKDAKRRNICVAIILSFMGISYTLMRTIDIRFWLAAFIPALIADYLFNIYWYPRPFAFIKNRNNFEFIFGNENYAIEFKNLNKDRLYVGGVLLK